MVCNKKFTSFAEISNRHLTVIINKNKCNFHAINIKLHCLKSAVLRTNYGNCEVYCCWHSYFLLFSTFRTWFTPGYKIFIINDLNYNTKRVMLVYCKLKSPKEKLVKLIKKVTILTKEFSPFQVFFFCNKII